MSLPGGHETKTLPRVEIAVDNPDVADNTAISIEVGVKDECAKRCVRVTIGWRNIPDQGLQDLIHPDPGLGRHPNHFVWRPTEDGDQLPGGAFRISGGQVDLVDGRDDLEPGVNGEVGVGQGLRLHTLDGINEE